MENENDMINRSYRIPFDTKVFKLKRIPDNFFFFFSLDLARNAFVSIIRHIELCRETQNNIDALYDDFCVKLFKEINENIPSFDCSKKI